MELKQHTVKSYDKDLESISGTIYTLLDMVNDSISMVKETIKNPDKNLVEQISEHDHKINHFDNLTERKVTSMLALRQPMAFDLRYVISALKVSANLERMGDKCKSIVNKISHLENKLDDETKNSLLKMLEIAKEMTKDAVFAFNEQDLQKATKVLKQDDEIDQIYEKLFSIAEGESFTQPQIKNIINILFIAKSFERLADHATNIAEMVKYVISGEIVE
ncbi:MAG: phoU [Rickettsiaceae bacterium]|jgi:phosphate transport system protein|nr:phoU [Rickettsiaceae bacterium]